MNAAGCSVGSPRAAPLYWPFESNHVCDRRPALAQTAPIILHFGRASPLDVVPGLPYHILTKGIRAKIEDAGRLFSILVT